MIHQRRRSSLCLAAVLATFAAWSGGCEQSQKGAKNADGRVAEGRKPGEAPTMTPANGSKKPAPGESADSPSHPAVSTQVGPVGETPEGDPASTDATAKDPPRTASAEDASTDSSTPGNGKRVAIPPPPGALPQIALTAAHRATCKVFAGDTLPPLSLTDMDGAAAPLDKLFGERLTVVLFWQHSDADAVEAVGDLGPLVLDRFGERGVRAVAIHVGAANEGLKAVAQRHHVAYPLLADADGTALAQVAGETAGLMPRIFLVDAAGRILWFDIEYSRTTRRDLELALRYLTRR